MLTMASCVGHYSAVLLATSTCVGKVKANPLLARDACANSFHEPGRFIVALTPVFVMRALCCLAPLDGSAGGPRCKTSEASFGHGAIASRS